jgi:hypothetical protein
LCNFRGELEIFQRQPNRSVVAQLASKLKRQQYFFEARMLLAGQSSALNFQSVSQIVLGVNSTVGNGDVATSASGIQNNFGTTSNAAASLFANNTNLAVFISPRIS